MVGLRKMTLLCFVISMLGVLMGAVLLLHVSGDGMQTSVVGAQTLQFWDASTTVYVAWALLALLCACVVMYIISHLNNTRNIRQSLSAYCKSIGCDELAKSSQGNDIFVLLSGSLTAGTSAFEAMQGKVKDLEAALELAGAEVKRSCAEVETVRDRSEQSRRDGLLSASRTLGGAIEGIHGASDNLLALSRSAGDGAKQQQRLVSDVSSLMSDLNAAIGHMGERSDEAVHQAQLAQDKARDGSLVVERTVESIRLVERKAEDLAAVVRDLGNQAQAVEKIMEVISDIADQTNLLALNAAIEAARAGDAGRGFAVVADEVRKLAEKTMNATREVAQRIEGIQGGVDRTERDMEETASRVEQAVALAQSSGTSLQEIVSLAGESVQHIDQLADAARQQADISNAVGRIVREVRSISETSFEGAENAVEAVGGLLERVLGLESMNSVFQLIGDGGVQKTVEKLATSPVVSSMKRDQQEQAMKDALYANASFELVYITDAQGRQVVSNIGRNAMGLTVDPLAHGKRWDTRPWFRQPLELGGTIVSEVYVSSATGDNCITVSTPVKTPAGEACGVLAVDINLGKATQGQSRTC